MSAVNHLKAKIGSLSRSRRDDDPELIDARRRLKEEVLAAKIQEAVASFPPFTQEQRDKLAILLKPASRTVHGD